MWQVATYGWKSWLCVGDSSKVNWNMLPWTSVAVTKDMLGAKGVRVKAGSKMIP